MPELGPANVSVVVCTRLSPSLSYLKSTRDIRLTYNAHASSDRITASVDADFLPNYGDEFNNWKSTSGYHQASSRVSACAFSPAQHRRAAWSS
jgi:hypothetical protein